MIDCKVSITPTIRDIYKRSAKERGISLQDYLAELLCKGYYSEIVGNRAVLTTD